MKIRILLFFLFLAFAHELFAFGRKQAEEEKEPLNPEWTLCITAFDISALSPVWQTAGDTVTRALANSLQKLEFRLRDEEESAH